MILYNNSTNTISKTLLINNEDIFKRHYNEELTTPKVYFILRSLRVSPAEICVDMINENEIVWFRIGKEKIKYSKLVQLKDLSDEERNDIQKVFRLGDF